MAKEDRADAPKTITLDLDALQALLDARVQVAVAADREKQAAKELDFEAQMRVIRGQNKPAPEPRYEECESTITGSDFTAKCLPSRTSPLGRVVDLENYKYPERAYVRVSDGGLLPDGDAADEQRAEFWRYWNLQRIDRIEFASGKLFSTHIRKSEVVARREREQAEALAAQKDKP